MMWSSPHASANRAMRRFYRAVEMARQRRAEALVGVAAARDWALECGQQDPGAFQARHGKSVQEYLANLAEMEAALTGEDAAA